MQILVPYCCIANGDDNLEMVVGTEKLLYSTMLLGLLVSLFNGISTFVGYLMPKLFS